MTDLRFKFPFAWLIAGGSGSGKTTHVVNFLKDHKNLTTNSKCDNVIYFCNQWQDIFNDPKSIGVNKIIQGLPTLQDIKGYTNAHYENGSIIIIDDFAHDITSDIVELFTVYRHHGNCSVILLSQNLFDQNKNFRPVSLNSQYITVFKNPRDKAQIHHFAKQFHPENPSYIVKSFEAATRAPYSYVLFDNHQTTPDHLRMRSRIFSHQQPMQVWLPAGMEYKS